MFMPAACSQLVDFAMPMLLQEEFEKLTERMRVSRERYKLADDVAGNYLLNKTNVAL
jgi:hypothetical protein